MSDPIFIVERRTPRQWRLEAATMVAAKAQGKGYSIWLLKRDHPRAERATLVMDALMRCARNLERGRVGLDKAFEAAERMYPHVMEGTSFSGAQSNGRPAMVVIKS